MTSSAHDADLKGNSFRRSIHPQSFIAVAFIFSELDRGASGAPPRFRGSKKSPVWIGLNERESQNWRNHKKESPLISQPMKSFHSVF